MEINRQKAMNMPQEGKDPLILSVGGGKGGVGKSMVSSNLAVHYAQAGNKVVLIDLDVGAANLHTIFGIRQPQKGLGEYFTTARSLLVDYLTPTPIQNLSLVAGSGFVPELANIKHLQKVKIINQMKTLEADLVILDLGAGSSINVIDFFSMTNSGVVVTTPEPTAIVNTYEFLKNVIYRILFRMFRKQENLLNLVKLSAQPENNTRTATVSALIEAVAAKNRFAAQSIKDVCSDLDFHLILNQARKPGDLSLAKKLHEICKRYLALDLHISGLVFHNEEVPSSVLRMSPISVAEPDSITTKSLQRHAARILQHAAYKTENRENEQGINEEFERALSWARHDYVENMLTQKRLQKNLGDPKNEILCPLS